MQGRVGLGPGQAWNSDQAAASPQMGHCSRINALLPGWNGVSVSLA